MYKIKQVPEDFIVEEIITLNTPDGGNYAYFSLKKKNYTTMGALEILSKKFNISLRHFGFAGNKDKNAITTQNISVLGGSKNFENYNFNDIWLKYLGRGKDPISLGDLDGNQFRITIRNLSDEDISKIKSHEIKAIKFPNLFGPQRFSRNNHLIGKAIIKGDFKSAIGIILENSGSIETKIGSHLEQNKNDYISALRLIPLKTRRLYVHSYQSFLFNKIASHLVKSGYAKDVEIPLIGFDFDPEAIGDNYIRNLCEEAILEEKISPRDFVTNQMPELSSEGGMRKLYSEIRNFEISEISSDELSPNMKKCNISFFLQKSSYATVAMDFILS